MRAGPSRVRANRGKSRGGRYDTDSAETAGTTPLTVMYGVWCLRSCDCVTSTRTRRGTPRICSVFVSGMRR